MPITDGYLHEASDRPSHLYISLHGTFDIKCHMTSTLWPCREELNRPENKGLKSTVDKLKSVKEAVDEGSKKYGKSSTTDLHLKDDLLRPTSDLHRASASCITVFQVRWKHILTKLVLLMIFLKTVSLGTAFGFPLNLACDTLHLPTIRTRYHILSCYSAGIPPLSWADTLVLGAKVSAELSWVNAKKKRLGAGADIDTISSAFGADFPLKLGRVDVTEPDPAGRFP